MSDVQTGVTVTVDGQQVTAAPGELVIDAAERAGVYIPRFCYHPRMKPVGMCRQCLVEIDTGRGPALQPSCMIECSDGMTVETGTPVTIKAQTGVLELLLVNHPLDCPVCDKGGECPLQDQAMSHGPGESRMVEEKRHYEKPIPVSDLVLLDRERCILCDRCTRFAKEVAGEPLIHFQDRGNQTQVNTFPDHPFASYYSGNTVQICPVGALTSSSYRFKARPWDLNQVESTCQGCAMGCRTVVDTSRDRVLRQHGVDIDPVNWGWLCDKGRFGFEAIESDDRLVVPVARSGNDLTEIGWSEAIRTVAGAVKNARRKGAGSVAVLGGARFTNEDAYAWAKLAKGVIGTDNVDAQMADGLPAELVLGAPRATIDELCAPGGTVLWIGPDPREELAVLFLRLRHAVLEDGVKLITVTPTATSLDKLATVSIHPRPGDLPAVVEALVSGAGAPTYVDADDLAAARQALEAPFNIGVGRTSIAEAAGYTVDAAATVLDARPGTKVLPLLRRANINGALDMGLSPGLLPGRTTLEAGADRLGVLWPRVPESVGLDAAGILAAAADGEIEVLFLLGADPLADFPDRDLAEAALAAVPTVVAVDLFLTGSAAQAHVILPAAGPNEVEGSHTNVEGRVSVLGQAVTPPGTARQAWMIAAEIAMRLGSDLGLESIADIWSEIEAAAPSHAGLTAEVLAAATEGVVVPLPAPEVEAADDGESDEASAEVEAEVEETEADVAAEDAGEAATEDSEGDEAEGDDPEVVEAVEEDASEPDDGSIRFVTPEPTAVPPTDAYALRLVVSRTMYDDGTFTQQAPSLAGLPAEAPLKVHPSYLGRLGIDDGTVVRAASSSGEVDIALVGDPGVPKGVAEVSLRRSGAARDLVNGQALTEIRVETK